MMKVTKATFGMIAANKREKWLKTKPMLQVQRKDGTWGKPFVCEYYDRDKAVEQMERLNPGKKYRLAE